MVNENVENSTKNANATEQICFRNDFINCKDRDFLDTLRFRFATSIQGFKDSMIQGFFVDVYTASLSEFWYRLRLLVSLCFGHASLWTCFALVSLRFRFALLSFLRRQESIILKTPCF
jgi:hypothetical protein